MTYKYLSEPCMAELFALSLPGNKYGAFGARSYTSAGHRCGLMAHSRIV